MEHSLLNILFVPDLEQGTVSPSAPQYAGVQGDNYAAFVSFLVPEALRGDGFVYRLEGFDGAGAYVTGGPLPMDGNGRVGMLLDRNFTAAGGQILLRLVVSEVLDDSEVTRVHSFDGRLYFADAPHPLEEQPIKDSISAMLARVQAMFDSAEGAFEPKWLSGAGVPQETTEGVLGQFYRNTENSDVYMCVGAGDGVYTWARIIRESDMAMSGRAGVVRVTGNGSKGLHMNNGFIEIMPATAEDIAAGANGVFHKRPITAGNMDLVVQAVIDALPVYMEEWQYGN